MPVIQFKNAQRDYLLGGEKWTLGPINFSADSTDTVCIIGKSGSGKSTLLHLLGALDSLSSGKIIVEGENIAVFSSTQKNEYRKNTVGFIFQDFHLFPEFTVFENVSIALDISKSTAGKKQKIEKILDEVGLLEKKNHYPSQLSGGQRQRVAIARALIKKPKILLADEPTGNLDSQTGKKILDLLFSLAKKNTMGLWIVTHDESIVERCERVVEVEDGKIV